MNEAFGVERNLTRVARALDARVAELGGGDGSRRASAQGPDGGSLAALESKVDALSTAVLRGLEDVRHSLADMEDFLVDLSAAVQARGAKKAAPIGMAQARRIVARLRRLASRQQVGDHTHE